MASLVPALLLSACALTQSTHATPQPTAQEAWPRASAMAAEQAGAGRYAAADRGLADFVSQYPGTREATTATLHRAVYMADPANQTATARGATALLDSLLATSLDSASRAEARVIRRITSALERGAVVVSSSNGNAASADSNSARPEDSRARDEEVQRLRSELAKANAELERIKKRVAQPKP